MCALMQSLQFLHVCKCEVIIMPNLSCRRLSKLALPLGFAFSLEPFIRLN